MKKILMALAIAACAMGAQATTFDAIFGAPSETSANGVSCKLYTIWCYSKDLKMDRDGSVDAARAALAARIAEGKYDLESGLDLETGKPFAFDYTVKGETYEVTCIAGDSVNVDIGRSGKSRNFYGTEETSTWTAYQTISGDEYKDNVSVFGVLVADGAEVGGEEGQLYVCVNGTGRTTLTKSFDRLTMGNDYANPDNAKSSWAPYNPTPVPEPTSGLLLLLGVAGLALKRKRA